MTNRLEFEKQLSYLRIIILDGVSYFLAWQGLNREYEYSIRNLHKREGFWWQYRGFLGPARKALLWSTLLQISKAYDTDDRTISLNNLLIAARNSQKEFAPHATPDSLEDIQAAIAKNIKVLQKLRRYRNKRLAHYDSNEMDIAELPLEEVNTLVEDTKSIFNSLKHSCEGKYDDFGDIMGDVGLHTSQVINILRQSKTHC